MDLTYLRKQSDYVSDLGLADLAGVRGMDLARPFCGGVFDWSFVRINIEALAALDKLAKPDAPLMTKSDFDFEQVAELQDMVVLGAGEFKALLDVIPLHSRSLARIDFDVARPKAALIEVTAENYNMSLARVLRHATTADFFDGFMEKATALLPNQSLAEFLFWELRVAGNQCVAVNNKKYLPSIPFAVPAANAPSIVFADNKVDAADILAALPATESAAVITGDLSAADWIIAALYAKNFLSKAGLDFARIPKNIILDWKNGD